MDGSGRSIRRFTRALSGSGVSFIKRPPSTSSNVSAGSAGSGSSGSSGVGVGVGGDGESQVSLSVKYVLDLFIAAYFQFDTTVRCGAGRGSMEEGCKYE